MSLRLFNLSRLLLLILVLAGTFSGCGQKGDLYLPDKATQAEATQQEEEKEERD
jgi:predicted small lipoprotein YifL